MVEIVEGRVLLCIGALLDCLEERVDRLSCVLLGRVRDAMVDLYSLILLLNALGLG